MCTKDICSFYPKLYALLLFSLLELRCGRGGILYFATESSFELTCERALLFGLNPSLRFFIELSSKLCCCEPTIERPASITLQA